MTSCTYWTCQALLASYIELLFNDMQVPISDPVIVALCVLHPEGVGLEALLVTRIDLPHHILGLPEARLAAYGPAQTGLNDVNFLNMKGWSLTCFH